MAAATDGAEARTSPQAACAPSPLLAGRFELRALLGAGGMGRVYRALDRATGREVAVKLLPALQPRALVWFKHEFRAVAEVHHENLVALDELHAEGDTWFFSMELVDGVDLLTWVGGYGRADGDTNRLDRPAEAPAIPRFDERRLRDAIAQLARGLDRLHRAGLVHCDIKPSNVLVTAAGRVVVLDYGLVASAQTPGTRYGTPDFMAPEQLDGRVDARTDWYAVGVMLFRALVGRTPFAGPVQAVLTAKRTYPAPDVLSSRPDAPRDLAALADALLQRAPGARPTGAAVLHALGVAVDAPVPGPLLGRDAELAALHAAIADARRGARIHLRLTGESGMGKTSLLRAVRDELDDGTWLLAGRCWQRESVPYNGFDGVVDDLVTRLRGRPLPLGVAGSPAAALARAFPVLRRLPELGDPSLVADARGNASDVSSGVCALLAAVARHVAIVVAIDDFQWADGDTRAVLQRLVDANLPNVMVVLASRDLEPPVDAAMRHLELAPLADAAIRALVLAHAPGRCSTTLPESVIREARGHPLFAAELARHAAITDGFATIAFDDVIRSAALRIGPAASRIATLVSLAHGPIEIGAVLRAAEVEVSTFHDTVRAMRAERVLAAIGLGAGMKLEPYHDRIRQSFTAALSGAARAGLHARLAGALEASPDVDDEMIASHWRDAGDHRAAARHAVRAADRAYAALAFHRAARLYQWSEQLATDPAERRGLGVRHAESLAQAGLGVAAASAFLRAADRAIGGERMDLRRRAMQQLFVMGHTARAHALLDEVAREVRLPNPTSKLTLVAALLAARTATWARSIGDASAREPGRETPAALARRTAGGDRELARIRIDVAWDAGSGLVLVDPLRSFYFHAVGLLHCLRHRDERRLARALFGEVLHLAATGGPARLLSQYRRLAHAAARDAGLPWMGAAEDGTVAFFAGRWREAFDHLGAAETSFLERSGTLVDHGLGLRHVTGFTRSLRLAAAFYLGRLRLLEQVTADWLRDALARNDVIAATHLRTGTQCLALLARGDLDGAIRSADDGIAPWRSHRGQLPWCMDLQARTAIDLYQAVDARAYDRVIDGSRQLARSTMRARYPRIMLADVRGRAALAAAAAGGRGRARSLADARRSAALLVREAATWANPLGHAIRAGVAWLERDSAVAARDLDRAARGFERLEMSLHAGCMRLLHAAALADRSAACAAYRALRALGVACPDRFAAVVLPCPELVDRAGMGHCQPA